MNPDNNKPEFYFDWDSDKLDYDDDAANNALKFTKNVVCLEVKGPNVPNLSLIDLPAERHHFK